MKHWTFTSCTLLFLPVSPKRLHWTKNTFLTKHPLSFCNDHSRRVSYFGIAIMEYEKSYSIIFIVDYLSYFKIGILEYDF